VRYSVFFFVPYTTLFRSQVYFDAAIMLTFCLLIGRFLDESVRVRAKGAAENLLGLKALAATVVGADGQPQRVPARALMPGMRVRSEERRGGRRGRGGGGG